MAAATAPLDALSLLAAQNPDVIAQPAGATAENGNGAAPAAAAAAAAPSRSAPEKAGFMLMNSYENHEQFKRYWFVLASNVLSYSESSDAPVQGTIQLEGCSCDICPESKYGLPACFELNSPLEGRLFALGCDNQAEMQEWINKVRTTMLKIRRAKAKEASQKKRMAVEGAVDSALQQQQQLAGSQSATQQQQQQQRGSFSYGVGGAMLPPPSSQAASASLSSYAPPAGSAAAAAAAAAATPGGAAGYGYVPPSPSSTLPPPPAGQVGPHGYSIGGRSNTPSSSSSSFSAAAAVPGSSNSFNSASLRNSNAPGAGAGGAGGLSMMTQEDKYAIYRQWLDETKGAKAGGGGAAAGGRKQSSAAGGELHHTLLDEEQSNKSTFERLCSCCPVWCFR